MYIFVEKYNFMLSGATNLKFGDQLCRFHISQLFLQKFATMDVFDVVLQWPCGLTGEQAQMTGYYHIKVTMGYG